MERKIDTNRKNNIDIAKGILILLVVIGHSIKVNYGFGTFADKVIYSFHMPAFFIISGFLMFKTIGNNEIIWTLKKSVQRVFPIIIFGSLYYLFSYFSYQSNGFSCLDGYSNNYSFLGYWFRFMFPSGMGDSLWFIWTLMWCGSIIAVFRLLSKKYNFERKYEIFAYLFICAVICCVKINSNNSFGVEEIQWVLPFFLCGYLISMNIDSLKKISMYVLVIMSIGFIYLCTLSGFGANPNSTNASVWLWNMSLSDSIIRIASVMCGTALIVLLSNAVTKIKYVETFLSYCGKKSLVIYVVHPLLLAMPFMSMGLDRTIVGTIISVSVSLLIGYLLYRVWIFRAFIFGEWEDIKKEKHLNKIFIAVRRKLESVS